MPCTTIELGEVQIEPGKPRYPLKDGVAPCERMYFSAASSSSLVVTPGRARERSICRQRAWIRPASAISSICSEVFLMIMPRYMVPSPSHALLFLAPQSGKDPMDPLFDLVGGLRSVYVVEYPALLVVVDQRRRLLAISLEP